MAFTFSRGPDDGLATAIFAAALLHGIVILGIRFSAPAPDDHALPTLEVLLVPDGPNEAANPEAGYLAQRTDRARRSASSARPCPRPPRACCRTKARRMATA
jgi:hypothetical protein